METQLVRLDPPYNIICGSNGKIALHIATLIVVKTDAVACYPVVGERRKTLGRYFQSGRGTANGQVWMDTELKDCYVLCPQNYKRVPIALLRDLIDYNARQHMRDVELRIAEKFYAAMLLYGLDISYPKDPNGEPSAILKAGLEFEEYNNGKSCMVYSEKHSPFYFYGHFDNEPSDKLAATSSEAIEHMAKVCKGYVNIFSGAGMKKINFTTRNEKYQWFVYKLNDTCYDG